MGIPYGKFWSDAEEKDRESTPLSARRPPRKMLSLASLDPRSPSSEIARTPIHIESTLHRGTDVEDAAERDPRSPTTAFQRTPLPIGKIPPETVLQGKPAVDQSCKKANCHESRLVSVGCETPKGGLEGTRSPLKAVSHPNCPRKSARKHKVRRQKTADEISGIRKDVDPDKENSLMLAEA